jgi:predicted dehydrogenase
MNKSVGIIGCGAVAQFRYVPTVKAWHGITQIYVYDIVAENSKTMASELNASVVDLNELIDKSDIIIITSPPHTHFDLLKMAVIKNKTVVCEKPFLPRLSEAQFILDQAKTSGARVYVAHMRRVFPSTRLAKQLIAMSVLGKIIKIEIFEGGRFAYKTKSNYEVNNPFGGVLLDTGSHALDQALFMCGFDDKKIDIHIHKTERNKPEPSHIFNSEFSILYSEENIPVYLKLSRRSALSNTINITFENGEMIVPLGMDNGLRIKNNTTTTMLYGRESLASFGDAFTVEYNKILFTNEGEDFNAGRFMNLTMILEKLLNANDNG